MEKIRKKMINIRKYVTLSDKTQIFNDRKNSEYYENRA